MCFSIITNNRSTNLRLLHFVPTKWPLEWAVLHTQKPKNLIIVLHNHIHSKKQIFLTMFRRDSSHGTVSTLIQQKVRTKNVLTGLRYSPYPILQRAETNKKIPRQIRRGYVPPPDKTNNQKSPKSKKPRLVSL